MIARADPLAEGEIGAAFSRAVWFKEPVNAARLEFTEQKVRWVEGIAKQEIARLKGIEHPARQGLLIAALAFARRGLPH